MHMHLREEKLLDAIYVWGFVVVFLRKELQKSDEILDELMHIPEVTLRHADSMVRLISLQQWRSVVDAFRMGDNLNCTDIDATPNCAWLFRKNIVQLIVSPLLECFKSETFETVLTTAYDTWCFLLATAVKDFNLLCRKWHSMPFMEASRSTSKRGVRYI